MLLQQLLLLLFLAKAKSQTQEEIDSYVNLINAINENAATYQLPKNNQRFSASGPFHDFGEFDFIVIGAGATGSVVANRLSEIQDWKILVLEAGHWGSNLSDIPALFPALQFSNLNWGYNTTRQTFSCLGFNNDSCPVPRGRGVGGTTLTNGLIYSRGYKYDFDNWAKLSNDRRWGYDSVLKYFKKSENFIHNDPDAPYDPEFHGHGGELNVEYHLPIGQQLSLFLEAHRKLGLGVADYNANKLGASPAQFNTLHGHRLDNGKAFLSKIINRRNLNITTESFVTKIRFEGLLKNKTSGVEFDHKGRRYFAKVRKEVILSAGAIASPQILLLSGVGPKEHLRSLDINLIKNLPVGSALRDNSLYFGLVFNTNYSEPAKPLEEYVKEFLSSGRGPLGGLQVIGFYESNFTKNSGIPEIEILMFPANSTGPLTQRETASTDETYEDIWGDVNVTTAFSLYIVLLHTRSVGTVRLKDKNPYEFPLINTNWLTDPEGRDIETLYQGIELALKLVGSKALQSIEAKLAARQLRACKQFENLSKEYWYCALRQVTGSEYHPMSTCKMGTSPGEGAVVDSKLRVFGIENLRVADASIFPLPPAGHPVAPCTMIGEQLGDLVKQSHGK